jgi:hypothetical protein
LLRREGLYSWHLTTWKRQRAQGERDALRPKKRGPKATISPPDQKAQAGRTDHRGSKKVAVLLGNPIPNIQIDEENG